MNSKIIGTLVGMVSLLGVAGAHASIVSVNPSDVDVAPGGSFTANIQADFTDDANAPVTEGGFLLSWNPALLSVASNGQSTDLTNANLAFFGAHGSFPFGGIQSLDQAGGTLEFAFSNCGFVGLDSVCEPVGTVFNVYDLTFQVAENVSGTTPVGLGIGALLADRWVGADGLTELSPDFEGATVNISAVPVPAAVWLFGSGLLGLVGVARRRSAIPV